MTNGGAASSSGDATVVKRRNTTTTQTHHSNGVNNKTDSMPTKNSSFSLYSSASFMKWTLDDVVHVATHHWMPCLFAFGLLFFMAVEYTLLMVPYSSPPFDLGFVFTRSLHRLLESSPQMNNLFAALNTGFLGSGVDFPVGNVSFFLFFSGHVAGSVIASLDMRRMKRWEMAWTFDVLNVLQAIRLLGTRGHYTIDLAVGLGAGYLFDSLAGKYVEDSKRKIAKNSVNGHVSKHDLVT
ncbi:hypothetical protein TSUD_260700 [Trifolium subterraneum]|uniref:AtPDCT1/2 transmembrane domain-containing protein n=1 Tax=Trifolium subterraneum TaxID=3900 RepID=A0A2Z6MG63_TRISU|nr:hypothetical protein TSUD_260700 [Trifolium subterraneum]